MKPNVDRLLGGRYRLTERIAIGGMGEVWRATDDVLGRQVAIKLPKAEYVDHPGFLERFRAEARHAAPLTHPGIASVHDYGEDGDTAYLVMELVEGEPLSALLAREGKLPPQRVTTMLAQAADALHAAHRAGVVHRDVKPGNLLVEANDRIRVTDFGIARAVDGVALTSTGETLGTAQYLSPEQASGQPVTPASDLYSLSVVGYEMLVGRPPFDEGTPAAVALAHVNRTPPALPDTVPTPLRAVIERGLAKEPGERHADAAAFAAALRDAAAQGSVANTPTTVIGRPAQRTAPQTEVMATSALPSTSVLPVAAGATFASGRAGRRPARWLAVAVLACLAIVALALAAWASLGDDPGSIATSATAPTATDTVPPTPTPVVGVNVDPAKYIGANGDDVVGALRVLGFQVVTQGVQTNDVPAGTVTNVEPAGDRPPGSTVTVFVAETDAGGRGKGNEDNKRDD